MSKEEQVLIASVIGKVTRRMEIKADKVGYNIDADAHWVVVHDILTDYDMGRAEITRGDQLTLCDLLERVGNRIGYSFWRGFLYYLERVEI
jgi:hypothetical protein